MLEGVLPSRFLRTIVLTAVVLTHYSCGPGCEDSCFNLSTVRFEPALSERGQYRLHVTTPEGVDAECVLTVPATSEFLECGLGVRSAPLPNDAPEVRGFGLEGKPSRIDVLLEKDGRVLSDSSIVPEYEPLFTCSGSCTAAETPLAVDVP
jgi:hypothetical protein